MKTTLEIPDDLFRQTKAVAALRGESLEDLVAAAIRAHLESPALRIKRVSRRADGQDLVRDVTILQRTINRLRGQALVRRGVYRFRTHEEAEAWMTREMAATHSRQSSKTS